MCRGGSVIVSPMGKIIAGPLYDQAGCLITELDLEEIILSKLDFDINGHYSRNDIFQFDVKDQPPMVKDVEPNQWTEVNIHGIAIYASILIKFNLQTRKKKPIQ